MAGKYTIYLRPTPKIRDAMLILMGLIGAIGIIIIAFSLLEASLARQDRVNQEQLIWRCNGTGTGNASADTCQLIGKA
jgi:hypothetical protein